MKRRENGAWWGGEAYLDGIRFIDLGTDSAAMVTAFDAGRIDVNDETTEDIATALDDLDLVRSSMPTAATIVARMRMDTAPYTSKDLRNAVQLAVDNDLVLQLGIDGDGLVAQNHHVAPFHPEYAAIPAKAPDPAAAIEMARAAGHGDTELELISVDGDWRTATADAIGAMLSEAGFNIKRRVVPLSSFWNDWTRYPFSTTNWAPAHWACRFWRSRTDRARRGTRPRIPTRTSTPSSTRRSGSSTRGNGASTPPFCRPACATAA